MGRLRPDWNLLFSSIFSAHSGDCGHRTALALASPGRPAHHPGMSRTAAIRVARLPLGEEDIRPTFQRERAALKRGVWPVAGCD